MKYNKGITIYKLHITVTDKDSFEECNRCLIKSLNTHAEIDEEVRKEIIKEMLS